MAYLVVVFAIKAATSSEIRSETFELCHNALLVALSFSMMCGALYGAKLRYDDEGLVDGLLCTHRDPEVTAVRLPQRSACRRRRPRRAP